MRSVDPYLRAVLVGYPPNDGSFGQR